MASSDVTNNTRMSFNNNSRLQVCIIGERLKKNENFTKSLESFNLQVVYSETGEEYFHDEDITTVYVLDAFEGDIFKKLLESKKQIFGPTALIQLSAKGESLPKATRPIYSLSMKNVVICFSGLREKKEIEQLVKWVHHMGGSVRKDLVLNKISHLIATSTSTEKYRRVAYYGSPVMTPDWIKFLWSQRDVPECFAVENMAQYKLLPFTGCNVAFISFKPDEYEDIKQSAIHFGGKVVSAADETCTHFIIEEGTTSLDSIPNSSFGNVYIVNKDWFWESAYCHFRCDENMYPFMIRDTPLTTSVVLDSASKGNKRKRLESIAHQLATESPQDFDIYSKKKIGTKFSLSGSFLDATMSPDKSYVDGFDESVGYDESISKSIVVDAAPPPSLTPREVVCKELYQTETNYVSILETILREFKEPLEKPDRFGEILLNPTEIKQIFGNLPPILEVHQNLKKDLMLIVCSFSGVWPIGDLMLRYAKEFKKSYPAFINFFEKSKEALRNCDKNKPRFHVFLKKSQSNPDCKKQTLEELLIRPVQRLPSVVLLLSDILKYTDKNDVEYQQMEKAIQSIKEVLTHINEDKRQTDSQIAMFDIVNDIEDCPPDLLSSHRKFIRKIDLQEIGECVFRKNDTLCMFLFTDVIEICKKRRRADTLSKSPGVTGFGSGTLRRQFKCYKHLELMPMTRIKRVVDILDSDECKNAFALVKKSPPEVKERLIIFVILGEDVCKADILRLLCHHIANSSCCSDAENLMAKVEPQQLSLQGADGVSNPLTKVVKMATKAGNKIGRALSMRRTPSKRGLYRAVSTIISPMKNFGQSPASLCEFKHGSVNNLTHTESTSIQSLCSPTPEKKMKISSLGIAKRYHL